MEPYLAGLGEGEEEVGRWQAQDDGEEVGSRAAMLLRPARTGQRRPGEPVEEEGEGAREGLGSTGRQGESSWRRGQAWPARGRREDADRAVEVVGLAARSMGEAEGGEAGGERRPGRRDGGRVGGRHRGWGGAAG